MTNNLKASLISEQSLNSWNGSVTTFNGYTGTRPEIEIVDKQWAEISALIKPEIPAALVDKKKGTYFVPCALKEAPLVGKTLDAAIDNSQATVGKMRSKNHITEARMLVMDIDGLADSVINNALEKLSADGLTYVAYTTYSHGDQNKPGMRVRLVVPVDNSLDSDNYKLAWHGLDQQYFNGEIVKADPSGANLCQQQGTSCCHPDRAMKADSWKNRAGVACSETLIALGEPIEPKKIVPKEACEGTTKRDVFPPSSANKVADKCQQIKCFRDTKGKGQSEPLWNDCLGITGYCEDGEAVSQDWSSGYDGYSNHVTKQKLEHRLKCGPTTCEHFKATNPEGCKGCAQDVRSPITLGWSEVEDESKATPERSVSNDDSFFDEVEPHSSSVDPQGLFTEIEALYRRHIVMDSEKAQACTLWAVHTWVVESVDILPILIINAPEKACGKTQLLDLTGKISCRALPMANITTASLFRVIDHCQPTLLIDEADTFLKGNHDLAGIINAGHSRTSAKVLRLVGDAHEPKQFNAFAPKALAGIGLERHLSDATMSRGISINLRRKTLDEKVERIRHADKGQFKLIQAKMARFAQDYSQQISQARPELPDALSDRQQDNWDPLLAIAACGGKDYLARATQTALTLSTEHDPEESIGNQLLSDIQYVFESHSNDRFKTSDLIIALSDDEEAPWATYNKGYAISPRQLAGHLKKYGIKSKTVRHGRETPKGYSLSQFEDVFARYIPEVTDEEIEIEVANSESKSEPQEFFEVEIPNSEPAPEAQKQVDENEY